MAQPITLTYGRVKYTPGEPRQTSHGMRINAVITLPSGEEIKLWGDPGDPALTALKKNQQVALAQNAKGNWQLVQQQDESVATTGNNPAQNQHSWEPEDRELMAARIEHRAKVMRYCLIKAKEHCGDLVDEEGIRAIATSLFIEALKR